MVTFADLEAACAARATLLRWQRTLGIVLAVLVLVGGTYPALYLGQLPHAHIFVGGPPPPNWEEHEHENPLDYLFGPISGGINAHTISAASSRSVESQTPAWASGRVVSVYTSAGSVAVLTLVGYALMAPILEPTPTLELSSVSLRVGTDLDAQASPRPTTPPPRN